MVDGRNVGDSESQEQYSAHNARGKNIRGTSSTICAVGTDSNGLLMMMLVRGAVDDDVFVLLLRNWGVVVWAHSRLLLWE